MRHDKKNPIRNRKPAASPTRNQIAPIEDGVSAALLNATVEATTRLLEFTQPADAALSAFFREKKSGAHDRAFIAETAYAVLRRKRLLESLASRRLRRSTA